MGLPQHKCPGKPEMSGALHSICMGHPKSKCPRKPEMPGALHLCTGLPQHKCPGKHEIPGASNLIPWDIRNNDVLENPKSLDHQF
jgi:hypothetical protein